MNSNKHAAVRYKSEMSDGDRLRLLAQWMDDEHNEGRWQGRGREAQRDLLKFAKILDHLAWPWLKDPRSAVDNLIIAFQPNRGVCTACGESMEVVCAGIMDRVLLHKKTCKTKALIVAAIAERDAANAREKEISVALLLLNDGDGFSHEQLDSIANGCHEARGITLGKGARAR